MHQYAREEEKLTSDSLSFSDILNFIILKRVKHPIKDFLPAGLPVDPEPGVVSDKRHWQKPW